MNPERWQQVRELLDRALAVEDSERAALLDAACANDRELRVEVGSLLFAHQQAGSTFLKRAGFDSAALCCRPIPKTPGQNELRVP
jgi:hypothetical protein